MLELKITKKGKQWWHDAEAFAARAALAAILARDELGEKSFVQATAQMRRFGKSFQMCLEASRRMLAGETVIIRSPNAQMAKHNKQTCIDIIEKSFPEVDDAVYQKLISTHNLHCVSGGKIVFSSRTDNEKGYTPSIIFEDEVEDRSSDSFHWPHHQGCRVVTSRDHLLSIIKPTRKMEIK